MRIRNNKVNVFLSDDEKFILKRASSKLNLSQSEYIRNLIVLDNRLNSINRDLEDIKKIQNIVGRNY